MPGSDRVQRMAGAPQAAPGRERAAAPPFARQEARHPGVPPLRDCRPGPAPPGWRRRRLPLLLLPLLPRPAAAHHPEIHFRIMREGSVIGMHRVVFSHTNDEVAARTEVDITVRVMGFPVFRLNHRFTEVWASGKLRLATSRRERNGRATEMVARPVEGAILARGPEGEQRLPPEAAPLTWWNPARLAGPVFDSETGRLLRVQWTRTPLPGGAVRWRASGEEESEASYAADGTWLDWRTRGEDGSLVTYERV